MERRREVPIRIGDNSYRQKKLFGKIRYSDHDIPAGVCRRIAFICKKALTFAVLVCYSCGKIRKVDYAISSDQKIRQLLFET